MKLHISIFALLIFAGCSHQPAKSGSADSGMPPGSPSISPTANDKVKALEAVSGSVQPSKIDNAVATKVRGLFQALVQNDDKKAKQNYGRASRSLPDLVQFAVDLKFHNFEHAKTALSKSTLTDAQKSFWQNIVDQRPRSLAKVLCEQLKANSPADGAYSAQTAAPAPAQGQAPAPAKPSATPSAANPQDVAWVAFYLNTVTDLASKKPQWSQDKGSFDAELGGELGDQILTDSFFDKLHNLKRRDTRNVKQDYKNAVKTAVDEKTANIKDLNSLLGLYKTLQAAKDNPHQMHFLRRFKGIGRDMRIENLANRLLGDTFLEDDKDTVFVNQLSKFEKDNQLISAVNRLDYELAECALPEPAPVR